MIGKVSSSATVFILIGTLITSSFAVVATETGPIPDPEDSMWMYVMDDVDGDGLLEKVYFLTRDDFMFGSMFEGSPPTIPYNDNPGEFSGDNVGIRAPGYQIVSDTDGSTNVLLDYQISHSNSAIFVSDTGGVL
ncbi:MAG: hypothetical protein JSV43_02600, partial [Methanobacteriota archaeon]